MGEDDGDVDENKEDEALELESNVGPLVAILLGVGNRVGTKENEE